MDFEIMRNTDRNGELGTILCVLPRALFSIKHPVTSIKEAINIFLYKFIYKYIYLSCAF